MSRSKEDWEAARLDALKIRDKIGIAMYHADQWEHPRFIEADEQLREAMEALERAHQIVNAAIGYCTEYPDFDII